MSETPRLATAVTLLGLNKVSDLFSSPGLASAVLVRHHHTLRPAKTQTLSVLQAFTAALLQITTTNWTEFVISIGQLIEDPSYLSRISDVSGVEAVWDTYITQTREASAFVFGGKDTDIAEAVQGLFPA